MFGAYVNAVVQVTDLPRMTVENGTTSSWLRYSGRRHSQSKNKAEAASSMICILLKSAASPVLATSTMPWATAIKWNEVSLA